MGDVAGTDEEEEQCAVCRMEFEVGEDVRLLPCSHFYHPACISQWLHFQKVRSPACNCPVQLLDTAALSSLS